MPASCLLLSAPGVLLVGRMLCIFFVSRPLLPSPLSVSRSSNLLCRNNYSKTSGVFIYVCTRVCRCGCSSDPNMAPGFELGSDLADCKARCARLPWCVGVSFDPNRSGGRCYHANQDTPTHPDPHALSARCPLSEVRAAASQSDRPWSQTNWSYTAAGQGSAGAAAAAKAAAQAEVVVLSVAVQSAEGSDRVDLSLGIQQEALIAAVLAAAPGRVVVAVRAPGAISMPWAANNTALPAILLQLMPGQAVGSALTAIIFGDAEPTGRLPLTFPVSMAESWLENRSSRFPGVNDSVIWNADPDARAHPAQDVQATYSEGLQMGYKYFDSHPPKQPLWPFGYGLGWNHWTWNELRVVGMVGKQSNATVHVSLSNYYGTTAATTIVQLYLTFPASAGEPPQLLRGFQKVTAAAGAQAEATFTLDARALSVWDPSPQYSTASSTAKSGGAWRLVEGEFGVRVGTSSRDVLGQSSLRGKLYSKKKVGVPTKTDDGRASSSGGGGHGSSVLTLRHTINNSKHSVGHDGLQYVVQARAYTSSPQDLVTTMRGGGVAVWRWGDDAAGGTTVPSLAVRAFVLEGVPTEGQDSLGDLLVIVRLNHGITTLDWPSMKLRGEANISVTGALHCKLWRDTASRRVFALITTGLTHVTADRDYLVAVEVTHRDRPVEVAKLRTPVKDTEGVLVLGDFAYVGGYVPNNKFVSVELGGLVSSSFPAAERLKLRSVVGPRPEYDNMVGALANSSFRVNEQSTPPLMFFGSYNRPGGLLIFEAQKNGSLAAGAVGELITAATARTNRVHIHPSGGYALLALEKGVAGTDEPPEGETGGIAVVDIRRPTAPTLLARAASPILGGRVYTASFSPSGGWLVAFSAQNQTAFVFAFEPP